MALVVSKKCYSYQNKELKKKLNIIFEHLGGLNKFFKKGSKVLLKVNLLMGKTPDQAVTTHPEFIRALAQIIKETGAEVIIADSPGGPYNKKLLKRAYQKSGILEMAEKENIRLNYNTGSRKVDFKKAKLIKSFQLVSYLEDVDLIINLPKLKTHGLTMYTGAVKNLFGCIPGIIKAEYHLRLQSVYDFSRMLNDLATFISPELTIMDAVVGMEGDGPSNGRTRKFNYLLASTSPFYLDLAAVKLMGIRPEEKVPSIRAALNDNLLDKSKLQFKGDEIHPLSDVDIPIIEKENNLLNAKMPKFLSDILENLLRPKPVFDQNKCVGCKNCAENCPPNAIKMVDDFPKVVLDNCIRCFCCQELCPYDAVKIKYPLLAKLFFSK